MVFLTAFLLGIAANLHCIGMCGPLALILPVKRNTKRNIFIGTFVYNLGRIGTYTLLGLILGFVGISLNYMISIQLISILTGSLMLIMVWYKYLNPDFGIVKNLESRFSSIVMRTFGKISKEPSYVNSFLFGIINGLLPCSMVYLALLNAVTSEIWWQSALSMTIYGVGTLPVMLVFSYYLQQFNQKHQSRLNRFLPYLVSIVALLTILRGMNLGIPYISPKVSSEVVNQHVQPSLDCCKKPK